MALKVISTFDKKISPFSCQYYKTFTIIIYGTTAVIDDNSQGLTIVKLL
jgi:hypothetical protein